MRYFVDQVNSSFASNFSSDSKNTGPAPSLFDTAGNRKYLTVAERGKFLCAGKARTSRVRTFCLTLAYSGARISEALALTPRRFDFSAHLVIVESLKKRRRGVFRGIPLPVDILTELDRVHHIRRAQQDPSLIDERIWKWSRTTAWKRVKECMAFAEISGPKASPKGLRHAFGVGVLQAGVPINLLKKWLGHARLSTTEIYADAIGAEEQTMASKFWQTF